MPTSDPEIDRLVSRYGLSSGAGATLGLLLERLVGDPLAPTSIRERERAVEDHLADSLVGLDVGELRRAETIVDIGSGAGLPGLPLAIALPGARVTLLEAGARKCRFIESTADACGLANFDVVTARAEAWPAGIAAFDVVTARALAGLDVVAEYAAPLLRPGGCLVAWRGRRDPDDEAAGAIAAGELGLQCVEPIPVAPYPGARYRHLHVLTKIEETPAAFPRRPGMARKRPLGRAAGAARTAQLDRGRR